jgi:hypothetical protein
MHDLAPLILAEQEQGADPLQISIRICCFWIEAA